MEQKGQFHSYIIAYGKIDSLIEKKKTQKAFRLQGCASSKWQGPPMLDIGLNLRKLKFLHNSTTFKLVQPKNRISIRHKS